MSLTLEGVTAEAVSTLLDGVRAIRHNAYVCTDCSELSDKPGKCPDCGKDLTPNEDAVVVAEASITVDRRFLSVTLHPRHWGSFAEIQGLVTEAGGSIRRELLKLPAFSRLQLTGVKPTATTRVKAALADAGLFTDADVYYDEAAGCVWVMPVVKQGQSVTVGAVAKALNERFEGVRITDVQWTTPCMLCMDRKAIRGGCPTCFRPTTE